MKPAQDEADNPATVADLRSTVAELEQKLRRNERLTKFNLFLRNVSAALVDVGDPAEVLDRLCERAVADAGFTLAWAGVEDDALGRVVPVNAYGPAADYVRDLIVTTDPALPTSHGPTRTAMIEQTVVYVDHFQTDLMTAPWRLRAEKYEIKSAASVPIVVRGKTRQVVSFYSTDAAYFDSELRLMLEECARRVSLAMATDFAERDLLSRNRLLGEMSLMALIGAWEMDPRTSRISGSDETAAIFEVSQSDAFDQAGILRFFPEADAAILGRSIDEAVRHRTPFDLELNIVSAAGRAKWLRVSGRPEIAYGEVVRLYGAVQDISKRKRSDSALRDSYEFNRAVLDSVSSEIAVLDRHGVIIAVNEPWRRFAVENPREPGMPVDGVDVGANYLAVCRANPSDPDDLAARVAEGIQQVIERRRTIFQIEYPCHSPMEERWFSLRVTPMELAVGGVVVVHTSVTERKRAERLHRRTERALEMLGEAGAALVRARTADDLYQRMCDIVVQTGGFLTAWVGVAEHDQAKTITSVAYAGLDMDLLRELKLSWADRERGRGVAAAAIRENNTQIDHVSDHSSRYEPWRPEALERGVVARLALPLRDDDGAFGALTIYATAAEAFGPEEVALLEKLAGDLSFGVVTLRDRRARDSLAAIVESSREAIIGVSMKGVITSWNRGAVATYGYQASEAVGRGGRLIIPKDWWSRADGLLEQVRDGESPELIEIEHIHKDGRRITVALTTSITHGPSGEISGVSAIIRDITEQKRIAAELIRSANFDSLTGLCNRARFTDLVRAAIDRCQADEGLLVVLLLDLDNFKDINDTLGPAVGDRMLKAVGDHLTAVVGARGVVARVGGDEFAIALEGVKAPAEIDHIAETLLDAISEPLTFDEIEMSIGAGLGIAVADADVSDAETLLSRVGIALNRAKDEGRGAFRHFTQAMDLEVRRRVTLGRQLRSAIDRGELMLFYQPQVEADTGSIIGVESLVRWNHPIRGIVRAAEFIPMAESIGLARAVGRWVIGEACRQIRVWLDMGLRPPIVAINVSATQFTVAGELERDLDEALARHGVTPDRLELELTETVVMEASAGHSETLLRLRQRGFALSIDDFGTGFSSLDYLRRFPADRIKIDQSFVKDVHATAGNEAIVKAIIGLARQLGMGVIAEGVETEAQRDLLRRWGCRDMQGYYFSHPAPAARLTEFLENGQHLPV